ncbi:universal stress protein [Nafulsella turpanensis]|uniref:universal stress protein n=1 Tax=Nafulsella turpanensis TaxID=1265690 RepID=UPI00034B0190|nr:universal stress protein [Nafulsella turpanensis]
MDKTRNILLSTDFSEAAVNALKFAIGLAKEAGGTRLIVLHSFQLPATGPVMGLGTAYVTDQAILVDQMQAQAREHMLELEEGYLKPSGLDFECVMQLGSAMNNINDLAKSKKVDLVVVANEKAGKLERLLGSLPLYALEHSKAPLLLVPDKVAYRPFRKMAFATDLKTYEREAVLKQLRYLAELFKPDDICVLNVHTAEEELSGKELQELEHIRQEFQGMDYEVEMIESEDAEEGILDFVEQEEVGLLAAIPRQHGFFEGLFHSSITKKLARHSHVPLLAIHE